MRRFWAALLAVWLWAAGGGALGEEACWWDITDTDITTRSGGTGGSPSEAPTQRSLDYEPALEGLPVGAAFAAWTEELDSECVREKVFQSAVDGRLLQNVLWVTGLGQEELPWRERDWRMRGACFDLATGARLGLSDLFYDGFNYIQYINDHAARALFDDTDYWDWYWPMEWQTDTLTEDHLRRPFSGFPRDYPVFRIMEGPSGGRLLGLDMDGQNPLFQLPSHRGDPFATLWIPLTDAVSPYGVPWVDITSRRPPGERLAIASVRQWAGREAADARINAGLEALARRAKAETPRTAYGREQTLYPMLWYGAGYLNCLYHAWNEDEWDMALLGAACFDLATGEELDGRGLWDRCENAPGAERYRMYVDVPHDVKDFLDDDYRPGAKDQYLGCWVGMDGGTVTVAWLDGTGECMGPDDYWDFEAYLKIPAEALGWMLDEE